MNRTLSMLTTSAEEPERTSWLGRLIEASSPEDVAALIESLAQERVGCTRARVVWLGPKAIHSVAADTTTETIDRALAEEALHGAEGVTASDGRHYALPLLSKERVALVMVLAPDTSGRQLLASLSPYLQLGVRQLYHA